MSFMMQLIAARIRTVQLTGRTKEYERDHRTVTRSTSSSNDYQSAEHSTGPASQYFMLDYPSVPKSYCTFTSILVATNSAFVYNMTTEEILHLPQCPCFKPKDASDCLQFDSRYLATTLDEAMFSFPNLVSTEQQPLFVKQSHPKTTIYSSSSAFQTSVQQAVPATNSFVGDSYEMSTVSPTCSSSECLECKLYIVDGFINNSKPSAHDSLWLEKQQIQKTLGKTQGSCSHSTDMKSKMRFSSKIYTKTDLNYFKLNQGCCKNKKYVNMTAEKDRKVEEYWAFRHSWDVTIVVAQPLRITRNGQDFAISAGNGGNYQKNTFPITSTRLAAIRMTVDAWQVYIYIYIYILLKCFGSCRAVARTLNVLRNTGTIQQPKWIQATIEIAAACECQVELGTPLHSLVMK
uniref:Homeobox domain-containing protein n=1 Tax=Heterorhabditis bacteriophora TaxID=37862 RepID=A0A1I7X2N0_HETBA